MAKIYTEMREGWHNQATQMLIVIQKLGREEKCCLLQHCSSYKEPQYTFLESTKRGPQHAGSVHGTVHYGYIKRVPSINNLGTCQTAPSINNLGTCQTTPSINNLGTCQTALWVQPQEASCEYPSTFPYNKQPGDMLDSSVGSALGSIM